MSSGLPSPSDPLAPIGPPCVCQNIGSSQQSTGLDQVGMIVDDQRHTMPMKLSQGLQQAIYRGAEVVQGLDNDVINLMPDNGTKDRR